MKHEQSVHPIARHETRAAPIASGAIRPVGQLGRPLFAAIALAGVALSSSLLDAHASGSATPLYEATLKDTQGKPFALNRLRGRLTVVNFWAAWCEPCVREMPELAALNRAYTSKNVAFVGIAADSDANVRRFLDKVRVDYPVLVAGFDGVELSTKIGNSVRGLPFTVVIDADGNVLYKKLGVVSPPELAAQLDAAIGQAKRR